MTETAAGFALRPAGPQDFEPVHRIFSHAVSHGTASFALEPPSLEEYSARMRRLLDQDLPFFVAVQDAATIGYAWGDWFRPRPGYRFTLESSVYVAPDHHGAGVGKALLTEVVAAAAAGGYRQLIAVIGDSANTASIALHRTCGFRHAGTLTDVGFKFERWIDSVYMQRAL